MIGGLTPCDTGEHCCTTSVVTIGKSGRPVAVPLMSLHATRSSMLFRNSADVRDDREVLAAGLDDRVAGLVRVERRVVGVDDDLATGESVFLLVHVLRPRLRGVDRTLEQTGGERAPRVGNHTDADLGRRDADVRRGAGLAPPPCPAAVPAVNAAISAAALTTAIHRNRLTCSPLGLRTAGPATLLPAMLAVAGRILTATGTRFNTTPRDRPAARLRTLPRPDTLRRIWHATRR